MLHSFWIWALRRPAGFPKASMVSSGKSYLLSRQVLINPPKTNQLVTAIIHQKSHSQDNLSAFP